MPFLQSCTRGFGGSPGRNHRPCSADQHARPHARVCHWPRGAARPPACHGVQQGYAIALLLSLMACNNSTLVIDGLSSTRWTTRVYVCNGVYISQSAAMALAWELPPNTFGAHYATFMGDRNFNADDRPPVRCVLSSTWRHALATSTSTNTTLTNTMHHTPPHVCKQLPCTQVCG